MRRRVLVLLVMGASMPARMFNAQPSPMPAASFVRPVAESAFGRAPLSTSTSVGSPVSSRSKRAADLPFETRASWLAPLASLVVPGTGQAMLGQQRLVAYLALDGFFAFQWHQAGKEFRAERNRYRALADSVARRDFGFSRPAPDWDYYELLKDHTASGEYDLGQGGSFAPETSTSTYNGKQWRLARETFWADPDIAPAPGTAQYDSALSTYQRRAIKPEFLWSWRNQAIVESEYRSHIDNANRHSQRAVSMVGLVAMNHLVSMVDAYIAVRIRRYGGAGVGSQLNLRLRSIGDPADRHYSAAIIARIPLPRR